MNWFRTLKIVFDSRIISPSAFLGSAFVYTCGRVQMFRCVWISHRRWYLYAVNRRRLGIYCTYVWWQQRRFYHRPSSWRASGEGWYAEGKRTSRGSFMRALSAARLIRCTYTRGKSFDARKGNAARISRVRRIRALTPRSLRKKQKGIVRGVYTHFLVCRTLVYNTRAKEKKGDVSEKKNDQEKSLKGSREGRRVWIF